MEVRVEPTAYRVTSVPDDYIDADMFALTVQLRAPGQWAVLQRGMLCLNIAGRWEYEPIPSERSDEWKRSHRFDLETALRYAKVHAPRMSVNGFTVEWVLANGKRDGGQ